MWVLSAHTETQKRRKRQRLYKNERRNFAGALPKKENSISREPVRLLEVANESLSEI